jgi:Tol biopolymer transport system component/predicted Ser/Thr protein kinase
VVGTTVSHYKVVEKLGEGGMAVVYRALDTRLQRSVAIKVLPREAMTDAEHCRRFEHEARAASALNHPNIITVYDIDAAGDVRFIAMEYVAGQTLDRLIAPRRLSIREVLRYAVQIADALAAAHAAGIVHRDLKPSNIMVTDKGLVKVLDFGVAKLTDSAGADDPGGPTRTDAMPRTVEGTILGTVAYMSPEQAEGRRVDARSDIFAFGSVLYEMVTGRRPFQGETRLATLSAILRDEPAPASEIVNGVPKELDRIITHCLRKDLARRFQHLDDVKTLLEALEDEADSEKRLAGRAAGGTGTRGRRMALAAAALFLAASAAGVVWWLGRERTRGPAQAISATRVTFDTGLTTEPELSPDGKLVVYASDRAGAGNLDLWIQNVAGGEANRLTSDAADEREPAFSPDGTKIAFRSEKDGGGIFVIPAFGGVPRLIAAHGRRPRFSPDGSSIAYYVGEIDVVTGVFSELQVVASNGGVPRRIELSGVEVASHPVWTPDGRHFLFVGLKRPEEYDWWVAPVEGGKAVRTGAFAAFHRKGLKIAGDDVLLPKPSCWIGDRIAFSGQVGERRNVWQVRLLPSTWQVNGDPEPLTSGTSLEVQPSAVGISQGASHETRVVFASLNSTLNAWSLPIDANQAKVSGDLERLTASAYDGQGSLSADGRRFVFASNRSGNVDIWLKNLGTGTETAVTHDPADEFGPEISADGTRLFYQVVEGQSWNIYSLTLGPAGQAGVPQLICKSCMRLWDVSADARRILFIYAHAPHISTGLLDLDTGRKVELLKHPTYALVRVRFSPDDRWLSVIANIGQGRSRVYVVPYSGQPMNPAAPPEAGWIPVTDAENFYDKPVWSPDGSLLYFTSDRDGFRCIWAQRLDPLTKRPVGSALDVYHSHSARQSILNADILKQELAVAPGRLVFQLGEITGNIWMLNLP